MTRDDVMRLAKSCGLMQGDLLSNYAELVDGLPVEIERLVEIVRTHERRKHQADIAMWKAQAVQAERWRGMALAKDPMQSGKVVQEIQREAAAYEREACAQLCEQSDRVNNGYFAQKIRERG